MTLDKLVQKILEAARGGIYRRQLMDRFVGTHVNWGMTKYLDKTHVAEAITRAKQRGMFTIPHMRDSQLGTYYQYDGEAK